MHGAGLGPMLAAGTGSWHRRRKPGEISLRASGISLLTALPWEVAETSLFGACETSLNKAVINVCWRTTLAGRECRMT